MEAMSSYCEKKKFKDDARQNWAVKICFPPYRTRQCPLEALSVIGFPTHDGRLQKQGNGQSIPLLPGMRFTGLQLLDPMRHAQRL